MYTFAWWHWFTPETFDITPAAPTCVYVNAHKINSSEFRRWVHSRLQVPSDPAHSGSIPEKDKNQVRRRIKSRVFDIHEEECAWLPPRFLLLLARVKECRAGAISGSRSEWGTETSSLFNLYIFLFLPVSIFFRCLFIHVSLFVCLSTYLSVYLCTHIKGNENRHKHNNAYTDMKNETIRNETDSWHFETSWLKFLSFCGCFLLPNDYV